MSEYVADHVGTVKRNVRMDLTRLHRTSNRTAHAMMQYRSESAKRARCATAHSTHVPEVSFVYEHQRFQRLFCAAHFAQAIARDEVALRQENKYHCRSCNVVLKRGNVKKIVNLNTRSKSQQRST
eukprot:2514874-Pleurochrysis_carterae.AAC.3